MTSVRRRAPRAGLRPLAVAVAAVLLLVRLDHPALIGAVVAHAPQSPSPHAASFSVASPFPRIWGTLPIPDQWLVKNQAWFYDSDSPVVTGLPRWAPRKAGAAQTIPFVDSLSAVRIMGGWGSLQHGVAQPDMDSDFVARGAGGALTYNWTKLHERLDPFLAAGITPSPIVLDNVPYPLAEGRPNATAHFCTYGQCGPPANVTEWGGFVRDVVAHLASHYGADTVAQWSFRVGTESDGPRFGPLFPKGLQEYIEIYDHAAAAVRGVNSSFRVGPANMAGLADPTRSNSSAAVFAFFRHCKDGVNTATGGRGAPVDWVAQSCYSRHGKGEGMWPPALMGEAADVMAQLRDIVCGPGRACIPMEVMEFGWASWEDDNLTVSRMQPGAFGAAWRLAAWAHQMGAGVSRVFHWESTFDSGLGGGDANTLLIGPGWLMAVGELLVGGSAGRVSIQTWPAPASAPASAPAQATTNTAALGDAVRGGGGGGGDSGGGSHSSNDTLVVVSACHAKGLQVRGIPAAASAPTVVVLAAWVADDIVEATRRHLTVTITADMAPGLDLQKPVSVWQYALNRSSSVLDVLHADMARMPNASALFKPGYAASPNSIDEIKTMLSPAGARLAADRAARYTAISRRAITPMPFDGSVAASAQGLQLLFEATTPDARAFVVSAAASAPHTQ